MREFRLPIRVYIEDTDAGGIVYYVNYLKFIERSRTELLRSLGYDRAAIPGNGLLLVVKKAEVDYRSPARLDDNLIATAALHKIARTYVVFAQEVRRGEVILCAARITVACVSEGPEGMRPAALPRQIMAALNDYNDSISGG